MASLQVRNVPADLHAAVRSRAADEGMSVSEYLVSVLRRELAVPSQQEWLARLAEREPVEIDGVFELDASRRHRDEELDRSGRD